MNLKITEFRSLKEVDLPLEGVIHISGPPGCGRSSLKIALDYLLLGIKDGLAKKSEISLGDLASITRQGRFIAESGTDDWAENQRILADHIGCLNFTHTLGFTSQYGVYDFVSSVFSEDSRDGVINDLAQLVDNDGFGFGAAKVYSSDLCLSRSEVIRILIERLSEYAAKMNIDLSRCRFRMEPEDGRIARSTDENLEKNKKKAQKDVNDLTKRLATLDEKILDADKEDLMRMMADKADLAEERASGLGRLRAIESELKRRADIADGLEDEITRKEVDAASLDETIRVLGSPEVRYSSNSKEQELWSMIHGNCRDLMDIAGHDAPKFAPTGEILVMGRTLNSLSGTEKLQWQLACDAAICRFVKFPYLIADWTRMPAWTRNWIWSQREYFDCVIMMEQSFDGGDRNHYGADTCLWLENGKLKERVVSSTVR